MKLKQCIMVLALLLIIACTKKNDVMRNTSIEVTDYAERIVKLEKPAEKIIVMADNALVVVKQLKAIDKVIALDSKTLGNLPLSILNETDQQLKTLPDVGKTKSPNYEQIISLAPDLILFKGNKESSDMLQEKTGIPVACIISKGDYDFDLYLTIGKLLGKDTEAKTVIKTLQKNKETIETVLKNISDSQMKSAYIVVQNSKMNLFRTQKKSDSLTLAKIKNVASNATNVDSYGMAEISQEEIIHLNPDFVFLDYPSDSSSITRENILTNSTFEFINAVKEKLVFYTHTFSLPIDYVYVISESFYYAHIAYPQVMTEEIYKGAINEIFETCYGIADYYENWKKSLQ